MSLVVLFRHIPVSHTDVCFAQTHSCFKVTLMFPVILFKHIHLLFSHTDVPSHTVQTHSFCCSVTLMFPVILFSTFILLFSHTDVPCHTVQTHSFCCSVTLMFPVILFKHIHFVVQLPCVVVKSACVVVKSPWCSLSFCSDTSSCNDPVRLTGHENPNTK